MVHLYHETQVAALCGVHCLNTLLQGPFFSEWDLAVIAQELDALERQVMAEGGVHTDDYRKYMAEGSGNVSGDGMFSSQVLSKALSNWNLKITPLHHPDMRAAAASPAQQAAYICHLDAHWFTVRPVGGAWWNFNSLFPAPQPLSLTYLDAFLNTLKAEGWTIFVVQGAVPAGAVAGGGRSGVPEADASAGNGRYWTPEEAKIANAQAEEAQRVGRGRKVWEDVVGLAGSGRTVRLRDSNAHAAVFSGGDEDAELQQAYLASLQDAGVASACDDDDAALAAAIAASLGDVSAKRHCVSSDPHGASTSAAQSVVEVPAATVDRPEGAPVVSHKLDDLGGSHIIGAAVPPEPDAGAGVCELSVRLPSNAYCQRRFMAHNTVAEVWAWLSSRGWDMRAHKLFFSFPRKALVDGTETLQQAGISRRECLVMERF